MPRRLSLAAVQLLLLSSLLYQADAQETQSLNIRGAHSNKNVELSGLITSRLSPKELERWRMIEHLVFAEDPNRQPLHPSLRNLWEWVETSGHAVFIEITRSKRTSTCTAGSFVIERFDPRGERHTGMIKLNLSSIDNAYIGPEVSRENGFIPFEGLSREERYAEVLGHELAHTVHILTSLDRVKKVEDMVEKTNEILLSRRPYRKDNLISPELKRMLSRRDALLKDLEKQAEEVEYVVWRELTASKPIREKMQNSLARQ